MNERKAQHCSPALSRRMFRIIGALSIAVLAGATHAAAETPESVLYRVDRTHSSVEFSIMKWSVARQAGSFRDIDGTVRMSPDSPQTAEVEIRVRTASLDTRNNTRDGVVKSDDFLDVANHPYMTFRSVNIKRNGSGSFNVTGDLTIRGVTRRIVAPVRFIGIRKVRGFGELASFETSFVVNRRDFGVLGTRGSGGETILGNEVSVHLIVTARRAE